MAEMHTAPYGSWKSPITSDLIVAGTVALSELALDGEEVYWVESRPAEGGRSVIVRRRADGHIEDVTPPGFNARGRVHEYGGGQYLVVDGTVYFTNFADQRLYRQTPGGEPQPLTADDRLYYADFVLDRRRNRLLSVREDHNVEGRDTVNTLAAIDLETGASRVIVEGNDFYSTPRLSPDGRHLAWLTWNHPNMPWDGTELWLAEVGEDGELSGARRVAGGPSESIFQPEWSPDGALYFVSDRNGWWNIYRFADGGAAEPLVEMEAEFGAPQWVFRMSTYGFASATEIVCACNVKGAWRLARLNTETKRLEEIETPYTDISSLRVGPRRAIFIGGSPTGMPAVVSLDLASNQADVLRRSSDLRIDDGYISIPEAVEFPTENGRTAYGFFYAPKNRDYEAPAGERPPLIVISHGGPTSVTTTTLRLPIQYWTSRGFGVLDVNYGGSTGYGRAYRERLNGQWGVVDVGDCVNGARFLVERGDADPDRLIIRGGSAGGYTTLAALTFRDFFKAGASYYGISDLEALEQDCHKFESRYNHSLIGPYPEARDLYVARSPIHFTERLSCPIIIFQGLEDKVVPPNQAEMLYEAVRRKGLPVAYVPFEGEQHGFRKAENIKRSLDGELWFYARVFGFTPDVLPDPAVLARFENFPEA